MRLRFRASGFDYPGSGASIVKYDVFRQVAAAPAAAAHAAGLELGAPLASGRDAAPAAAGIAGWDFVGTLPAYGDSAYTLVVPTLADSNDTGIHRASFFVRAATAAPGVFFDSPADSGYSVDNLPPLPPAPFTAAYAAGTTHLHWGASPEPDVAAYRLYRGSSPDFTPGPGNRIATLADTGYADPGPAGGTYKLSAVDANGNESGCTLLTSDHTTGVPGDGALSLALRLVGPNPSEGGQLALEITLPGAGPARLELLDVGGRRVADRDVGRLGAGRHTVELSSGGRLAPGLYLVRLEQGGSVRVTRAAVLGPGGTR